MVANTGRKSSSGAIALSRKARLRYPPAIPRHIGFRVHR
jgi:hypothetical protein